jgi:hypothetical protein
VVVGGGQTLYGERLLELFRSGQFAISTSLPNPALAPIQIKAPRWFFLLPHNHQPQLPVTLQQLYRTRVVRPTAGTFDHLISCSCYRRPRHCTPYVVGSSLRLRSSLNFWLG